MKERAIVFGEVLFDHFPDGKRVLGGAPFNVAWHLQAFGQNPLFVSRVGKDSAGEEVKSAMQQWGMDSACLQTDPHLATGKVRVSIHAGEPAYDIVYPAAWDAIQPVPQVREGRLLYHGSLALRSERSWRSWKELHAANIETVFVDVNLRPPWFHPDLLVEAVTGAHWVKLNKSELEQIANGRGSTRQKARSFISEHGLEGLLLTNGAEGAAVYTRSGHYLESRPACGIVVEDTVGAGDALAAVFILGLTNGWSLPTTLDRAQAFASAMVGRKGATVADPDFYRRFANEWNGDSL